MASVKNGFSFGSARTAGDGAGDCDQGDGGACSNSSYFGVGGRGISSSNRPSRREAIDLALSAAEWVLLRLGTREELAELNIDDSFENESDRGLLKFFGAFEDS